MKLLFIKKFLWLILFTLIHLWFMVFNWQLFITMLNVNLGFGVVRMPPFVVLFLTGFVILAIHSWTGYVNKLHRIIHDLKEELARKNKDRTVSRDKRPGVASETRTKTGSRVDGIPTTEQVFGSNGTQKNPADTGERKEEGNRSVRDPKN
jgi:hypothetical protein